ncbi:MAG: alanine racemase [Flavobacteriaceae bacterium]|nr:alanine racemase [Flavobacteriaceae bacterium]
MNSNPSSYGETVLEIDLNALAHNYRFITSKLKPETKVMAVVKAFGYGSDACEVAKELEQLGVDYFAVAYVKEGVALRNAGVRTPILVLHPQTVNFEVLIDRCLEPTLYSARIMKEFVRAAESKGQENYPVHIKFNTGLNRLGFWGNDSDWIMDRLSETTSIKIKSLFSHLAASEDASEKSFTLDQIEQFKEISEKIIAQLGYRPFLHQSNTSAIINYPEANFDMVRTGIGLYGYGNSKEADEQLSPVVTLKSIISQIHKIEPGESVGYNRAFKASGYEVTATLPLGHADGISRSYGNQVGHVLVHGKKAPIIGNVCMDMLMINVTGIECKEGDEVIIIGASNPASDLAESANSISYELLTALSQRIKRVVCRKQ